MFSEKELRTYHLEDLFYLELAKHKRIPDEIFDILE
jgi:hypothetical protein